MEISEQQCKGGTNKARGLIAREYKRKGTKFLVEQSGEEERVIH